MKKIEELHDIIEGKINIYRQSNYFFPAELYDPVFYTLSSGGKRIRPVLLLMGLNLFTDKIEDGIANALAIEFFHNFTLLHDDIMDNSSQRRNQPTVHTKWNINTAILSGDAMMIMGYHFMAQSPDSHLSSLMHIFNKAALEVCEGQQYDMNFELQHSVHEEDYLKMIKLKTSVLLAAALQMGAVIGNADKEDQENLYQFGLNLGMAFQLQDDYLDTYGDQNVFGKFIGNDILANKKTFLLVKAIELSSGELKHKLDYWLRSVVYDTEEKIKQVTSIYDQLLVPSITKEKINYYYQKSLECLSKVSVNVERKEVLAALSGQIITRKN